MARPRRPRRLLVLAATALPVVAVGLPATVTPTAAGATISCPAVLSGVHRTAPGSGRTVALTFDDGPGRDTAKIMAVLAAAHVTATFFNLGLNESHSPATVRSEAAAGYLLGDHTWDHKELTFLSAADQAAEMDRERSEQASITGADPCLFRPPYGSYNATTLALATQRGMHVWNWSVDTEDWKAAGSGASYWVDRIVSRADAGGSQLHPVILMHNQPGGNPATVAALPRVISYYRAHGYTFVDLRGNTGRPTVHSVTPAGGRVAGGTRIEVVGTNFRSVRQVRFGAGIGTGLRVASPTSLWVTTPAHAGGYASVVVYTDHGASAPHWAAQFRYVPPPTITAVTPAEGSIDGGTRVRIDGTNFVGSMRAAFGYVQGTLVRVASPTTLYVTTPAHASGVVKVEVSTAYGYVPAAGAAAFAYLAPPPPPAAAVTVTVTVALIEAATSVAPACQFSARLCTISVSTEEGVDASG